MKRRAVIEIDFERIERLLDLPKGSLESVSINQNTMALQLRIGGEIGWETNEGHHVMPANTGRRLEQGEADRVELNGLQIAELLLISANIKKIPRKPDA